MKKYSRYIDYLKPCFWYLAGGIGFGILYGASSGFGMPFIIDKVLRRIFYEQGGENEYSLFYVIGIAALIPAVFLLRALTGFFSGYFMSYAALDVLKRLREDLFAKIQTYPVAFFDKFTTGDVMVRLSGDTSSVQVVLLNFASEIFRQPLQVAGALGFLFWISISKGEVAFLFVFAVAVPFCILPVQIIRRNLKSRSKENQKELSNMAQLINENLGAVHEVRVFGLQERENKRFEKSNSLLKKCGLKIAKYELIQQPSLELLAATLVAVTFVYAYFAKIDFSTFAAIGVALYFTRDPIKRVVRLVSDFIKVGPMFERLNEVLDYKTSVPEPEDPVDIGSIRGDIDFENVNFAYGEKSVLGGVNVRIPAGTSCALVGESGAGKSTFAKLAMRLYDPMSGDVKVDGVSLKKIATERYYENIGSVPQYPVLFNDTVFNNIALARPGASADEVYAAARAAYADEFIKELENGYDTMVGERGDRLSGGQKQRIAIARVFLKNPPLVFLDEATSALDSTSESFIQKALDNLMRDKTVIIIAHRFSTIRNVDKILVFQDGAVVGFGSHSELMEKCPHYKKLYEASERA